MLKTYFSDDGRFSVPGPVFTALKVSIVTYAYHSQPSEGTSPNLKQVQHQLSVILTTLNSNVLL